MAYVNILQKTDCVITAPHCIWYCIFLFTLHRMAIPSAWGIAAATMLFVSGVLFCIGFSTPNWTLRRQGQNLEGLWQDCFDRVYDASTHIYTSGCASNTGDHAGKDLFCSKTCLVGLLIRSIFRGKNCTSASARVQFFQRKIERINRPTRHVFF